MEEEKVTCQICMERFSKTQTSHLPKILPCCHNYFCLDCLEDIYKRNTNSIKCPVCRKSTAKDPKDLETNLSIFAYFFDCFNCKKQIIPEDLYINLDVSPPKLVCKLCKNSYDYNLAQYLVDIKSTILEPFLNEIMGGEGNSIANNTKVVYDMIDKKISSILDKMFSEVKEVVKKKLRERIFEVVQNQTPTEDTNSFKEKFMIQMMKFNDDITDFLSADKTKVPSPKILEEGIINFSTGFYKMEEEKKNETTVDIKIPNDIIHLKYGITEKEIINFFEKIYETGSSEEKKEDVFPTGISCIDNTVVNRKQNKVSYPDSFRIASKEKFKSFTVDASITECEKETGVPELGVKRRYEFSVPVEKEVGDEVLLEFGKQF